MYKKIKTVVESQIDWTMDRIFKTLTTQLIKFTLISLPNCNLILILTIKDYPISAKILVVNMSRIRTLIIELKFTIMIRNLQPPRIILKITNHKIRATG